MNPMAGEHIQRVTLPLEAFVRAAAEEEAKLRGETVKAILIYWLRKSVKQFSLSTLVLPCERCGDDCILGVTPPQRAMANEQWQQGLFKPCCETCLTSGEAA